MAGAYIGWLLHEKLGIDPYLSIPVVVAASFVLGIAIYRGLVRHLPRGPAGAVQSLVLLFGVWLVLRNAGYLLFSGNDQTIRTEYSTHSVLLAGVPIAVNRLAGFLAALATLPRPHLVLTR